MTESQAADVAVAETPAIEAAPVIETTEVKLELPKASQALAEGLSKLVLHIIEAHKAGGGTVVEIGADLAAAIQDLGPSLASAGALGNELSAAPLEVAEAFAIAGFNVAKGLMKK